MELRFLKGDWEFGKYKLQYRLFSKEMSPCWTDWIDVPTVLGLETEKSVVEERPSCGNCGTIKPGWPIYVTKEGRCINCDKWIAVMPNSTGPEKPCEEIKYNADFLWPHEDDSLESILYEFANAKSEDYRKQQYESIKEIIESLQSQNEKLEAEFKSIKEKYKDYGEQ